MAKKSSRSGSIVNRRARYDYELGESFVVGLQLSGPETKSLRRGRGQLNGAYVTIKGGELWLINALVGSGPGLPLDETEQTRTRKLLAKRSEIDKLAEAKQRGDSIVPLEILTRGRYIKLRLAIGRGRKRYDKRETIKRRQQQRDIAREAHR